MRGCNQMSTRSENHFDGLSMPLTMGQISRGLMFLFFFLFFFVLFFRK